MGALRSAQLDRLPLWRRLAQAPPGETVQRPATRDVNSDNEKRETIVAPERTSDDLRDFKRPARRVAGAALRDRQLS